MNEKKSFVVFGIRIMEIIQNGCVKMMKDENLEMFLVLML